MLTRTGARRITTALLVGTLSLGVGAVVHQAAGAGAVTPPASTSGSVMRAVNPIRILDTRPDAGGPTGVPSAAPIGARATLQLQVSGATGQGGAVVPANLVGAMVNVTAVNATAATFLRVYPCDGAVPASSTLNPTPGVVGYNSALVALSADGKVCIYNNAGSVDVVVDVTGVQLALAAALQPGPLRIDAAEFHVVEGETTWLPGHGFTDATTEVSPVQACLAAPVRIPDGAVLQAAHLYAREGSRGVASIGASLMSRTFGSSTGGASIGFVDNTGGTTYDTDLDLSLAGVSGHAIDADRVYEIVVCINVNDLLMGAEVEYTLAA